jgi:hypothetical protein
MGRGRRDGSGVIPVRRHRRIRPLQSLPNLETRMSYPESEKLDLAEDMERLGDIGDLILIGASIEEFGLTEHERNFVEGYVEGALGE